MLPPVVGDDNCLECDHLDKHSVLDKYMTKISYINGKSPAIDDLRVLHRWGVSCHTDIWLEDSLKE